MHSFTIIPIEPANTEREIAAIDASAVLNVVSQLGCGEADVLQDGSYSFSVRLSESGMWSIFQRDREMDIGSFG